MATISLTDDWRLRSDERCWKVEQRTKNQSQESGYQWTAVTYHNELEDAAKSWIKRRVRASDAEGYPEVLAQAEVFSEIVSQAVVGISEEV